MAGMGPKNEPAAREGRVLLTVPDNAPIGVVWLSGFTLG